MTDMVRAPGRHVFERVAVLWTLWELVTSTTVIGAARRYDATFIQPAKDGRSQRRCSNPRQMRRRLPPLRSLQGRDT